MQNKELKKQLISEGKDADYRKKKYKLYKEQETEIKKKYQEKEERGEKIRKLAQKEIEISKTIEEKKEKGQNTEAEEIQLKRTERKKAKKIKKLQAARKAENRELQKAREDADAKLTEEFGEEGIKALEQLKEARRKQKSKIKDYVTYHTVRNNEGFFITFTYKDGIEMKDEDHKRRCIRAMEGFDDYIINIDWGKKTKRRHFHAIAYTVWEYEGLTENAKEYYERTGHPEIAKKIKNKKAVVIKTPEMLSYIKNTGYIYAERIKKDEKDRNKLASYIAKLIVHTIKVKQSYIATKRGTEYQQFKKLYEKLKKENTRQNKFLDNYQSIQGTLRSDAALIEEFHKIGEQMDVFATFQQMEKDRREQWKKWQRENGKKWKEKRQKVLA